jgi:hypothetical protein
MSQNINIKQCSTMTPAQQRVLVSRIERARWIQNQQAKKKYEEWRKKFAEPTAVAEPPKKTVNDLVRIATSKSKRVSSGCMKLGSKPRMTVPFPLWRVVLQNCTASHINDMLANVTTGSAPLQDYENYEPPFQLPRQPATELDC